MSHEGSFLYQEQNKSPEEIATLCEQSIDFVLDVLKKHNL